MLYEQIRYAHTVRGLYRLRHLLAHKRSPDMGTRLGYPKYSKQFYRIKSRLREEGIIGGRGTFVESLPNMQVAMMPLRVDGAQISVLGNRVPYVLFLALVTGPPRTAGYLAAECRFSRKAVYDALRAMADTGLVRIDGRMVAAEEGSSAREWLAGYLAAVRSWTDISEDASTLFRTIPSYMGGPHVRRLLDYEPGTLMGRADAYIFTYEPFLDLMESIVRESPYFRRQPRRVYVRSAGSSQVIWVDGMPYRKDDVRGVDG